RKPSRQPWLMTTRFEGRVMRWPFWKIRSPPPCENSPPLGCPQREATPLERAQEAMRAVERAWRESAENSPPTRDFGALAAMFRSLLMAEPSLRGWMVQSSWVRQVVGTSCTFKDFGRELGKIMRRVRKDTTEEGKRAARTYYVIPAPAEVVKLR